MNDVRSACKELYNEWRKYSYGIPVDGHIKNVPTAEYYNEHWKLLTPKEFVKVGGGVCWDFVEFGRDFLEKKDIPFKQFYISTSLPGNDTHTIITCMTDDDKIIYPERSFRLVEEDMNGVGEFGSYEDIFKYITKYMFECNNNKSRCKSFKYYVWEYVGHPKYGCDSKEFMQYASKGEPMYEGITKYDTNENKEDDIMRFDKQKIFNTIKKASNDVYVNGGKIRKVENYKFDKVYFGTPNKIDSLTLELTGPLFVTPYLRIASIFAVRPSDFQKYGVPQGISFNRSYDEWKCHSKRQLMKPLKELHIKLETTQDYGVKPVTDNLSGYIYELELDDELKTHLFVSEKMNSDKEICIDGISEVVFKSVQKVDVKVHIREEPLKRVQESALNSKQRNELSDSEFGIPETRQYPLNDKTHVLQAVRFFNKAEKKYKKELAKRILRKAHHFKMDTSGWDEINKYKDDNINESSLILYNLNNNNKGVECDMNMMSKEFTVFNEADLSDDPEIKEMEDEETEKKDDDLDDEDVVDMDDDNDDDNDDDDGPMGPKPTPADLRQKLSQIRSLVDELAIEIDKLDGGESVASSSSDDDDKDDDNDDDDDDIDNLDDEDVEEIDDDGPDVEEECGDTASCTIKEDDTSDLDDLDVD